MSQSLFVTEAREELNLEEVMSPCSNDSDSYSSLGPESTVAPSVCKPRATYVEADNEDDDDDFVDEDEDEVEEEVCSFEEQMRRLRRERLVHGPSRANLTQDRHRIRSLRQFQLNQFILRESKAATVTREDHHIMLRQLIATAYFADAERREHRAQWRQIVAAVRKEYWGANAILSLSPDPYHTVLAKLSSMMLWNESHRRWDYTYSDDTLAKRRVRQEEVLAQLQSSGKLFLSE